jgi:DNA-directed RNA polymerase subunit RPC12/RpoP
MVRAICVEYLEGTMNNASIASIAARHLKLIRGLIWPNKTHEPMSDFKFLCPSCGQHISGDTGYQGTEIACPACQKKILVPQQAAPPPPPPVSAAIQPLNVVGAPSRTSGLAIASLVCSASSIVTGVGWLPGIICGHLAKARIRRDSSLRGKGLATAGLVIGYGFVTVVAGAVACMIFLFSAQFKQALNQAQLASPAIAQTSAQSVSNDTPDTVTTTTEPTTTAESGWRMNLKDVEFPDGHVSGKLHGMDFEGQKASFKNGELKINYPKHGEVDIRGLGASIENGSYEFLPATGTDALHIQIKWTEDGEAKNQEFTEGYAMKLKFGKAVKRKIHAQIYLCLPDDSKSYLAGTFDVPVPKKKQ